MEKIKVLVVDKRELFREGLAKILEREPNIELVSTCSTGLECIQKATELKPDVILLDTEILECDHIEATRCICELLPETGIIILTHSEEAHDIFPALKKGAKAYMTKDVKVEDLIGAIVRVNAGEVLISPPMATKLLEEFALLSEVKETAQPKYNAGLTRREREVLTLVAKGTTNREIASILFITENTVKVHLSSILGKLHVQNRQQAAAMAIEKGIVDTVTRSDT